MAQKQFISFLKQTLFDPLFSFVFPELCVVCNALLKEDETYLCASCHTKLIPLDKRYLQEIKEEIQTHFFDELYIIYEFDPIFQTLIHLLKYQRFMGISKVFADALQTRIKNQYDCISAVPLNAVRIRERGYNQSALIAENLAKKSGSQFNPDIIVRIKNTPSQTKLNRGQRIKNMQNAFICHEDLKGQRILLIDDVITTGSTLNACAQVLKAAGAKRVDIGALAAPVGIFQKSLESALINKLEIRNEGT